MKKQVRQTVLEQLKKQNPVDKLEKDQALLNRVLSLPAYQEAQTIATYLAFPHEYDTSLLISQAQKDGKRVLVPKTYPQGRMIFVDYEVDGLEETSFGLLEPKSDVAVDKSEIDLIHVPGLAFNTKGYRIGYGAGYYDRYLADFQGATISTIYACQSVDFEPDTYDIAIKEVLLCP